MKKYLLILLLFLTVLPLCAQRGDFRLPRRGLFWDAGVSMGIDNVVNDPGMTYALFGGINYRITPRFSLGLGVGIYKTEFVAAYLHLNFNLRREHSTKDNYPYIGIQAGGVYSTWIGENFGDERGFMMEPRLGWSFYSKKGQLRYNVFAGANLFSFSLTPKIGIAFEL